jgi:hypothetical protein
LRAHAHFKRAKPAPCTWKNDIHMGEHDLDHGQRPLARVGRGISESSWAG